ncbi:MULTISPECIES: transposase DNA-binding-containing protein [Rhizobium]|nr:MULTISPECIES: transposase DNA-binding-containing protein [Rhizobium]
MSVRDDLIAENDGHWNKQEIDAGSFKDGRLGRRCSALLRQLGEHIGCSISFACQDWASTKKRRIASSPIQTLTRVIFSTAIFPRRPNAMMLAMVPILVLQATLA